MRRRLARPGAVAYSDRVSPASPSRASASVIAETGSDASLRLRIAGRLDSRTTGHAWRDAFRAVRHAAPRRLVVDASGLDYCDGSGVALLGALRSAQEARGAAYELEGLRQDLAPLVRLLAPAPPPPAASRDAAPGFVERVGRSSAGAFEAMRALVVFTGELTAALGWAIRHPRRMRWRDASLVAQRAGADAVGIVSVVGFLFGLILSFQSATALQRFAAEIFMADGLAIGIFREMGGLITAVLLAGRSGSAFAAEIGTMKVNEEIDALTTMGLDPLRFLVVTRVVAAVAVTPLLVLVFDLFAMIGGLLVFTSFGYGVVTFVSRATAAVTLGDFLGGLFKPFVFAILVAAIGCLRGLQTRTGASAVGVSATSAVVSGIVLIALADGILAVVYYVLGI